MRAKETYQSSSESVQQQCSALKLIQLINDVILDTSRLTSVFLARDNRRGTSSTHITHPPDNFY
jgi:arginine/ornithine N-succinyltransferase beta subunit